VAVSTSETAQTIEYIHGIIQYFSAFSFNLLVATVTDNSTVQYSTVIIYVIIPALQIDC
jgi:hypothetical protein